MVQDAAPGIPDGAGRCAVGDAGMSSSCASSTDHQIVPQRERIAELTTMGSVGVGPTWRKASCPVTAEEGTE